MDLGMEGGFLCHRRSVTHPEWIESQPSERWSLLRRNRFRTVFACDILPEARSAWASYMRRFGTDPSIYHLRSVVELVKAHQEGEPIFPGEIDVVTGGFPCQDFSVAGKRMGFNSRISHSGQRHLADEPSEETRGKLYSWMRQVIDIVHPKMFIAENVKGLVSLGDVKEIIQRDFSTAGGNGYIVLPPRVLHAGNYGVPETRERVIFIGIRRSALREEALQALERERIPAEWDPYPMPTHDFNVQDASLPRPVTCGEVLDGLAEPDHSDDPSQRTYSKAKFLDNKSQGQTEISLDRPGPTIRSEHHGNIEYRRLSEAHGGRHLDELRQGLKERRLTPRECALIQAFPPDFPFVAHQPQGKSRYAVSPTAAYKVIGNAVPPLLAYHIARRVQENWARYFG